MKYFRLILITTIILFAFTFKSSANYYIGGGVNYMMPSGEFSEINQSALGFNLQLESRAYCNWWFGLRFDRYTLDPVDNLDIGTDYYEDIIAFSPGLRYNFLGSDCKEYNFVPYGQLQIPITSMGNTDASSRLGIGATAGAGLAYSFKVFSVCWMIDANARYSFPNIIYKDETRDAIRYLDLSLSLTLRI
jgi:hypothetical protein